MAKILIENGQNGCFLKMLWPKLHNPSTTVIYIIAEDSKYSEGSVFFVDKIWCCQRSKFCP